MREIEISMVVNVPNEVTEDIVTDKFIEWVNSNKWFCGGRITDVTYENGRTVDVLLNSEPTDKVIATQQAMP